MKLSKTQRQHRVSQLLEKEIVTSQAELVRLLALQGVEVTQVTASRDLEELGAVKVRRPGGALVYALAGEAKDRLAPDVHLRRVLGEWVVDVTSSANLVVVRTPPGCAHVVASALDRSGLAEVIGTVAGDDTVLVILEDPGKLPVVKQRFEDMRSEDPL